MFGASRFLRKKTIVSLSAISAVSLSTALYFQNSSSSSGIVTAYAEETNKNNNNRKRIPGPFKKLPSREEEINKLKNNDKEFDLVIIGGGATGSGIALDAATRGLNVCLLERFDFSSGTSSKSTKLVHGGVRYLEKAIWNLDYGQYKLVREALHERKTFLDIAPHLSFALPIMLPVYTWWQVPYFYVGTKMYDLLSGRSSIGGSYLISSSNAKSIFPTLKADNLKAALVYYDGSQNDSRMNVSLALTAAEHGATVLNYFEVENLLKDQNNKVSGVIAIDNDSKNSSKNTYKINAKAVINATGPFTDSIRNLDDLKARNIVAPSSGVHVVLPEYFCPDKLGLLDPNTSDGRVIFFLPWQGKTVVGTTDSPCKIENNPIPSTKDIQFVLKEVSKYIDSSKVSLSEDDVLAAWEGIRPLVKDPNAKNTESLVRNHLITVSPSNLITIAGGKWTTYREMARETVDKAIEIMGNKLDPTVRSNALTCKSESIKVVGANEWHPLMHIDLAQLTGLEPEVAKSLASNYGDRCFEVADLCSPTGRRWPAKGIRLSQEFPYVDGEVRYVVRNELARKATDVIGRRTRLSFLNSQAALEALPTIIDIMAEELKWSESRKDAEWNDALNYLYSMGLSTEHKWSRKDVINGKYADWENSKLDSVRQKVAIESGHQA